MKKKFKIWIITIFPELFERFFKCGIPGSAFLGERGIDFEINIIPLGDYTFQKFKGIDDSPYGGGPGMIMRADVLKNAYMNGVIKAGNYGDNFEEKLFTIYTSPRGKKWNREICKKFSKEHWSADSKKDLVFICGRYEGVDERFLRKYVDIEISLGDYVLTGGELAVQIILDSSIRFVTGMLGNEDSSSKDSFENFILEEPQYTKPRDFEGELVPEILLSGNHKKIDEYRKNEQIRITKKFRPDLYTEYLKKEKDV